MKKRIYFTGLLFLFLAINFLKAQKFLFTLYFEDAAGHRDSVTLGFSSEGSEGIDEVLGEENIIGQTYKNGLDVRVSDEWLRRTDFNEPGTFHTKSQIINNQIPRVIALDIKTGDWPVTASWDPEPFREDESIAGTLFTSIPSGGWWDTGSPSNLGLVALRDRTQVTFTTNSEENFFNKFYSYLSETQDTIPVFWFLFGDDSILPYTPTTTAEPQWPESAVRLYPNPFADSIHIHLEEETTGKLTSTELYNDSGRLISRSGRVNHIITRDYPSGIYVLKLYTDSGVVIVKRLVKAE